MKRHLLLVFTGFILFAYSYSYAQSYRPFIYNTKNGLPSDNVYCAAQDANGYMYFGTDFGLVKFDGLRFMHYSYKEGLINQPITDLITDKRKIYIAAYPDALQTINTAEKIDTLNTPKLTKFGVEQLVKFGNDYFIYKRNSPLFAYYRPGKEPAALNLETILYTKNIFINCITTFSNKALFCTSQGIYIWGDAGIQLLKGEKVFHATVLSNGEVIIAGDRNLYILNKEFNLRKLAVSLPPKVSILHMEEDGHGDVWLRGLDKGIYRLSDNNLIEMSAQLGLANISVNKFFKDREGNFWLCTAGAGILFISRYNAEIVDAPDGLVSNKTQRLLMYNGKLIIGTQNGLSLLENKKITTASLPSFNNQLQYVYRLFKEEDGVIGICMTNVFDFSSPALKGKRMKEFAALGQRFRFYYTSFAWPDGGNTWYYSTRSNWLYRFANTGSQQDSFYVGPYDVRRIYDACQQQNVKWFGTDKGILQISNQTISLLDSINGEKIKQVFDFYFDNKGNNWLATDVGVFLYDGKKFTTLPKANSYGTNYCTAITADNKNNIWVATWNGIIRFTNNKPYYYNTSSGLSSRTVNSIAYDTATGYLYAGTDNGLNIFYELPEYHAIEYPVTIKAALLGTEQSVLTNQALSPNQNDISFYFSIPHYLENDEKSYAYRLNNGGWKEQKNPDLSFSNLSGGTYTLTVKAQAKNLGLEGPETVFTFTIKTPFYKKTWFILLSLALLQLTVFAVYTLWNRKRKQKKLKQQLALQQQMLEQASLKQQAFTSLLNPHFIFNALNSVQHFINQQDRQNANRYLSDFASLIRKNFDASLQTFIPLEEEIENLRLYLQLEKMRFGNKINYTIQVSDGLDADDWMFPTMLLQPFLENAILHGLMPSQQQGELSLLFAKDNTGNLLITIADNGIGLQKSKEQRQHTNHKSRGMELIQERLTLLAAITNCPVTLKAEEHLPGQPNPGTRITISYPAEVYNRYKAAATAAAPL